MMTIEINETERQVLQELSKGYRPTEIDKRMHFGKGVSQGSLNWLRTKSGTRHNAQLMALALRRGWIKNPYEGEK